MISFFKMKLQCCYNGIRALQILLFIHILFPTQICWAQEKYELTSKTNEELEENVYYQDNAIRQRRNLWINKTIPYELDLRRITDKMNRSIQAAIAEYHAKTCIRFVKRTTERNWVKFTTSSMCSTRIGRQFRAGYQVIYLSNICDDRRAVLHELMHTLGFYHEMSRPDRDLYVEILWENVAKDSPRSRRSLKDGDVTNEECRRLIITKLDDIKSKLDGLARKDLRSSLCFLTEGISGLYQSLRQFPSNENTKESTERATLLEASSLRDTGPDSSGPINEAVALINALTSLKLHSNEHFKSAIESFKLAREKATEAFCNEALSIEDRIQATQIRMMVRILEKLEHPDASVNDCLQYLQQLHNVGAIREIFSVLIDGGFKSWFNQTMRHNNASSVQDMNAVLFNFARKFTKFPVGCLDWPTIFASEEIYNPVCGEKRDALVEKLEISGQQLTLRCSDFTFDNEIFIPNSVVNSKGEIVAMIWKTNTIKIFKRSGESRTLCEVPREEHVSNWDVAAMDIDAKDNIYVITTFQKSDDHSWRYKLFIFDDNGNKKLETPLSFHQCSNFPMVQMAINKDGMIAIFNGWKKILYIGKGYVESNTYEVEKSFHLKEVDTNIAFSHNVQISDVNGTKILVSGAKTVYIYTENGQLQRKIVIGNGPGFISSMIIDHTTNDILATTFAWNVNCEKLSLLSVSETGKLVHSLDLGLHELGKVASLTSHPNGAVVLVGKTEAMLIKGQQK